MRGFFIPILMIGVGSSLFFGFTTDLMDGINKVSNDIAFLDQILSNAKELKAVRNTHLEKYKALIPEDLEKLNKLLPDRIDNVRLIIDVDNIAARYGMTLKNVRVKSDGGKAPTSLGTSDKPYASVGLSFAVSSSYENVQRFLIDLEKSLRLVDINSVSFTAGDKDFDEYQIDLVTYWSR